MQVRNNLYCDIYYILSKYDYAKAEEVADAICDELFNLYNIRCKIAKRYLVERNIIQALKHSKNPLGPIEVGRIVNTGSRNIRHYLSRLLRAGKIKVTSDRLNDPQRKYYV